MNAPAGDDRPKLRLSIGQCAALATIMEATAPKPGNVHRGADFEDLTYPDFMVSAIMVAPVMDAAVELPLGQVVLWAVQATQASVATNSNLGTILLIAPLAKVPRDEELATGVAQVLSLLSADDSRDVYQAIALANPGGLGKVDEADVADEPPDDLLAAMRLAADRDRVARQYAENYHDVFHAVAPGLKRSLAAGCSISDAIVHVYLELMSAFPDSLIARRLGVDVAQRSAALARQVLEAGPPRSEGYEHLLGELDFWLRADGHRRNPGTTADLVAAGLFAGLRDGWITPPFRLARSWQEEDQTLGEQ